MGKESISVQNQDRFLQIGIAISTLRRIRGLSQQQLSAQANISRSHLSAIEAPGLVHGMSLDAFFNIADSLEVDPAELINVSLFLDRILKPRPERAGYSHDCALRVIGGNH